MYLKNAPPQDFHGNINRIVVPDISFHNFPAHSIYKGKVFFPGDASVTRMQQSARLQPVKLNNAKRSIR